MSQTSNPNAMTSMLNTIHKVEALIRPSWQLSMWTLLHRKSASDFP